MKTEAASDELMEQLARLEMQELEAALHGDSEKKAFWINIYNAANLYLMRQQKAKSGGRWRRLQHFRRRQICIAGERFSLMEIENGILRRGRLWWALGYLVHPFLRSSLRKLQVKELDARIHFALNCGAMSCPPIRFYEAEKVEAQLEMATRSFMQTEVAYDPADSPELVKVSGIFRLYLGDFGGQAGIRKWIVRYRQDIPSGKKLKIEWAKYDHTAYLGAFEE